MKSIRVIGLTNEMPAGDLARRILTIPFGKHPHWDCDGCVQLVNSATGGKLVQTLRRAIANGKLGAPVYCGHPDDGDAIPADPNEYGRVVDAEVRSDCVALTCDLTAAGLALVRSGKRYFSPHWIVRLANSVAHPFELLSIGLTDRPLIPVAAIANEKHSAAGGGKGVPMRDKLIALLKKQGIECPAEMSDDDVMSSAETALGKSVTLANELAAEKAKTTNLEGTVTTLKSEVETEKGKVAESTVTLANERKARQGILLDQALADGRVPPVARKQWEGEFATDFAGTIVKLANAQPVMKVENQTGNLAARSGNSNAVGRIVSLVNEEMKKSGAPHHEAHLRVKAAHPELFTK